MTYISYLLQDFPLVHAEVGVARNDSFSTNIGCRDASRQSLAWCHSSSFSCMQLTPSEKAKAHSETIQQESSTYAIMSAHKCMHKLHACRYRKLLIVHACAGSGWKGPSRRWGCLKRPFCKSSMMHTRCSYRPGKALGLSLALTLNDLSPATIPMEGRFCALQRILGFSFESCVSSLCDSHAHLCIKVWLWHSAYDSDCTKVSRCSCVAMVAQQDFPVSQLSH